MGLFLTKTFQRNFKKLSKNRQEMVENALREIYKEVTYGESEQEQI